MDFELFSFDTEIESTDTKTTSRKIKIQEKLKTKLYLQKQKAKEVLPELPSQNECHFIIANGTFDYFTLIPIAIDLLGGVVEDFYFSTWTMNEANVQALLKLFDDKKILKISALVGLYFKQREAAVFNNLYEGLKQRGQKIFSNENHSKVTLLKSKNNYINICGSANFTSNPRIEQFTIHNNKDLYEFNKVWMDEVIK